MLKLIGIDGDDTLWHSEGYYRDANAAFMHLLGGYVDLQDASMREHMLATERRNLDIFGYGAKGMTLSMVETAIALTGARVSAADIHRVVELGKQVLAHPVELLPGIVDMLDRLVGHVELVLITKGDLLHQEQKVLRSGLAERFQRIEIVSEKSSATYARILDRCGVLPEHFAMVGNSLRSDIEPVLRLGGWAVHLPYRVTWAHEQEHSVSQGEPRMRVVSSPAEVPAALAAVHAAGQTSRA